MKTLSLYLSALLLSLIPQALSGQERAVAETNEQWLPGFLDYYEQNREVLEQADPRNRKLFGNASFFVDIDEKDLILGKNSYTGTVKAASRCLRRQFPILREAFEAGRTETCVNVTTGYVFMRGRAEEVDFAGMLPIVGVTALDFCKPLSITFVCKNEERNEPYLINISRLHGRTETDQSNTLTRFLSSFGKITVEKVLDVRLEEEMICIDSVASFDALGISGQLRLVATNAVVHLELTKPRVIRRLRGKPFIFGVRGSSERRPDWKGERNVIEQRMPRREREGE